MGAHRHRGTPQGALTPICNDCGISLCWDISDQDYAEAKPFWDQWICQDCNSGIKMSLHHWKQRNPDYALEPVSDAGIKTITAEEGRAILSALTADEKELLLQAINDRSDKFTGRPPMADGFKHDTPHITYLEPQAHQKLLNALANPKPPTQALKNLMRMPTLWNKPSPPYTIPVKQDDCLLSLTELRENVEDTMFTDADGFGHPVRNGFADKNVRVNPSQVDRITAEATHILWLNK